MKTVIRRLALTTMITAFVAGCVGDEPPEDELAAEGELEPEVDHEGSEMTLLAQFDLGNGNTILFSASEASGDIASEEVGAAGTTPRFDADASLSVLDKYLRLAPEGTPVPRLLANLAPDRDEHAAELAARPVVEALSAPVVVPDEGDFHPLTHVNVYNCGSGNTAANFATEYCHYSGSAVEFCDSGAWQYLIRVSPLKAENSYSATTYCGSDFGHATHLRYSAQNKCCNFPGTTTAQIGNGGWRWMHLQGPRRYRRVDHYRGPYAPWDNYASYSGHVRGHTLFFDNQ